MQLAEKVPLVHKEDLEEMGTGVDQDKKYILAGKY